MEMTLDIRVQETQASRIGDVDFDNIKFGRIFSDHQFIAEYSDGEWKNPRVVPYGDIQISPAMSAIHYGQSIFEGMKAYKNAQGEAQLFRPEENWKRLNRSAKRMGMPELPRDYFMDGLTALLEQDKEWIPTKSGSSLYLRPFMFATDDFIGVRPSDTYLFMIFSCPVNAYYNEPLKVRTEPKHIRAAEGGVGSAKCAGNYGAVMEPTRIAQAEGYNQIMWLDSHERRFLEETGTTNLFVRIGDVLHTPSLEKGTILEGITRDSIITLVKHWGLEVQERSIPIDELFAAHQAGTLKEVFASGTAATVAAIEVISHEGERIELPSSEGWEYFNRIKQQMTAIKMGETEDPFGWVYKV